MEINKMIESTNLDSKATMKDIEKLCNDAIKYHFDKVVVHPYYVSLAKGLLKNTNILVVTVVGFPLGINTREVKVFEAIDAVSKGADEIDMVINISALKNKDYEYVKEEIEEIRDAIDGKTLKVIVETSLLTDKELIKLTEICNDTFVNYIKTCTGFNGKLDMDSIDIINKYKNELLEIKASGGIKDLKTVKELMDKGVSKIGTSNGKIIMDEYLKEEV